MNEQQLEDYLNGFLRFIDVSEADQNMTIMPSFKEGVYDSCEAEWESVDEISDYSTKLIVSLDIPYQDLKQDHIKNMIRSGHIRQEYVFPMMKENATVQVDRIIKRLAEHDYPEDYTLLTRILTELEREAQMRVMDTLVIHIEEGAIQQVKGNAKVNLVILDADTEDLGLDEDEVQSINGTDYYRYVGIRQSEVDAEYVSSVVSQLKD